MASDSNFYQLVGDGTVLWGSAVASNQIGYAQGFNTDAAPLRAQAKDAVGATRTDCLYDPQGQATGRFILVTGAAKPAKGASVVMGDVTGHVISSSLVSSNEQYQTYSVTIQVYLGVSGETMPDAALGS